MGRDVILDTNVLLNGVDLTQFSKVYIPITVLEELDKIKHNSEGERNYKARKAIKDIESENNVEYKINYSSSLLSEIGYDSPDNRIIACAKLICDENHKAVMISGDINILAKCKAFDIPCEKYDGNKNQEIYYGYKEITLTEYEQAIHYECPINKWNLVNNEYVVFLNEEGKIIDKQRWTDEKGFTPIQTKGFSSIYLDDFKPKDAYQMFACDSLVNTDFTLLLGVAGSGKTLISLSYIMQQIAKGKAGKAVIIFNPAKLKNNEQLGYYSGNRIEKMLQNSIGGILASKLGAIDQVETLINQGKLMIIPTSDIRGIEISNKDILYVTEAQNTDSYTMRTILQRAKEGCKIIIEGDMLEQQDIRNCGLKDNGMMRAIDVFMGTKYFSCVKLKNTYRSPISEIAQKI